MAIGTLSVGTSGATSGFNQSEKNYVKNAKEVLVLFTRSTSGDLKQDEVISDVQILVPESTRFLQLLSLSSVKVKELIPQLESFCKQNGLELNSGVKYLIHYA